MPESRATVLVVDDDVAVGKVLSGILEQEGFLARYVSSGADALKRVEIERVDVVITDLRMPGMDGMELLGRLKKEHPELPVIMLTAHGTVALAVDAMKAGASEFVLKPFDRDELLFVIRKELQREQPPAPATTSAPAQATVGLIGDAPQMKEAMDLVRRAASGDATVLIRGESGTGKEQLARALHQLSRRKDGPLVKLHCAGLPDSLLESELFGYEKGAFTGAVARKPGRVELAQGGTLFLDEIGDTTAAMQVKLLRLLQEKEYERLGGTETLKADVRFVAATHRPLEQLVASGTFREDLFYRLNVVPIWLPALRERPGDIPLLTRHFVDQHANAHGKKGLSIDPAAIERLGRERWPGNVRQLQNFLERLVVLADARAISVADVERELARQLPMSGGTSSAAAASATVGADVGSLDERKRGAEREAIEEALKKAAGNRTLAARLLGVSRRTLYNKLEEHGIG